MAIVILIEVTIAHNASGIDDLSIVDRDHRSGQTGPDHDCGLNSAQSTKARAKQ